MSGYLLINTRKNRVENIVVWDGDEEINWGDNLIAVPQPKDRVLSIGDSYTDHIVMEESVEKPANRNNEPEVFETPDINKQPVIHAPGEEPPGTVFILMDNQGSMVTQQTVRPVSAPAAGYDWFVIDPMGHCYRMP